MSVWVEGRVYDYYGTPIVCVRRYFDGSLEMVELKYPDVAGASEQRVESPVFTRTARALAPCVTPRVTDTLGGVLRPDACDHRYYARVSADAGPHAGKVCCAACGAPAESEARS